MPRDLRMEEIRTDHSTRPNIVLVMSDQHNASVMGCAGNPIVRTPNLDRLASRGVCFTNAYCPYPLCAPSRMGFMSGQYPSDTGVFDNGGVLSSQIPTFAHRLGTVWYEAALCGRMHFASPDPFHGFERRIFGDVGSRALSPEILGTGSNRTNGQTKYAVEVAGHGRTGFQLFDQQVTDAACNCIANRPPGGRPYCLVVGFILPHNPLVCSRELFDVYYGLIAPPDPVSRAYLEGLQPAVRKWRERRGVDDLTPEQNRRGLAAYYGLVTEFDGNVGKIVEAVESSPEAQRTVIVYCSDHGDMACEHGMWWKSSFYEGSSRVPLIISWPGRFPQGAQDPTLLSLIDVGPTVLELAGADPLPDVAGMSFAGRLSQDTADADSSHEVYSEYLGLLGDRPSFMIRTGPWKLNTYSEFGSCQLFHLEEDPGEVHDRTGDPGCASVVRECLAKVNGRYSAARMLEAVEAQQRAADLTRRCGHAPIPHPVPPFEPPEGSNVFDFGQLGRAG